MTAGRGRRRLLTPRMTTYSEDDDSPISGEAVGVVRMAYPRPKRRLSPPPAMADTQPSPGEHGRLPECRLGLPTSGPRLECVEANHHPVGSSSALDHAVNGSSGYRALKLKPDIDSATQADIVCADVVHRLGTHDARGAPPFIDGTSTGGWHVAVSRSARRRPAGTCDQAHAARRRWPSTIRCAISVCEHGCHADTHQTWTIQLPHRVFTGCVGGQVDIVDHSRSLSTAAVDRDHCCSRRR